MADMIPPKTGWHRDDPQGSQFWDGIEVFNYTTRLRYSNAIPGPNEDGLHDFGVGTIVIDTVTDTPYICLDNTTGSAVWSQLSTGASSGLNDPWADGILLS